MIKVEGRNLWRGGVKIGFIEGGHVFDHAGNKIGFYTGDLIYDQSGRKIAFLEGDYIFFNDGSPKIRIENNNEDVVGGSLSNVEKAAVRILLGE